MIREVQHDPADHLRQQLVAFVPCGMIVDLLFDFPHRSNTLT
jgi:hypothetical protein